MSATAYWYGKGKLNIAKGGIAFLTDTIKVALCTVSYVPNQATDEFFSSVTNELPATGNYVSGGIALGNKTVTYDSGTGIIKYDADDFSILSSTITDAAVAVIYKDTTNPATSPLLGYILFGENKSTVNTEFKITWDAAGIINDTITLQP